MTLCKETLPPPSSIVLKFSFGLINDLKLVENF